MTGRKLWIANLTLMVVLVMALALACVKSRQSVPPWHGDTPAAIRDDVIDHPWFRGGIFAPDPETLERAERSTGYQVNNEFSNPDGYQKLVLSGRVQGIPQGTPVSVLEETEAAALVRVNGGLLAGKIGYVPPQVLAASRFHLDKNNVFAPIYAPR